LLVVAVKHLRSPRLDWHRKPSPLILVNVVSTSFTASSKLVDSGELERIFIWVVLMYRASVSSATSTCIKYQRYPC
jgi:hypothetical protein